MTVKPVLRELLATGDALAADGDLPSLIHVVAQIEEDAAAFAGTELLQARDAIRRWQDVVVDHKAVLTGLLTGRRRQRKALRTYREAHAA